MDGLVASQIDSESNPCAPSPPVRGPVATGLLWIAVFVAGFAVWSALVPLQSAAVALGAVSLDTYRKTVQHLEGGIIKEILVREGQSVRKGQPVIKLDETQAKSKMKLLQAQVTSLEKQLSYTKEELQDFETLLKKQLVPKTRVLDLRRRTVELEGNIIERTAQLHAAKDVHSRLSIQAPISGTVVGLQTHTQSGVIKPGQPLLSIISQDERLVIEAKIDPNDIDVVHKSLPAQIRLTPLNARMVPPLPGQVIWVSADKMSNDQDGSNYYLARIEISELPQDLKDQIDLYPGMPARDVFHSAIDPGLKYFLNRRAAPDQFCIWWQHSFFVYPQF